MRVLVTGGRVYANVRHVRDTPPAPRATLPPASALAILSHPERETYPRSVLADAVLSLKRELWSRGLPGLALALASEARRLGWV